MLEKTNGTWLCIKYVFVWLILQTNIEMLCSLGLFINTLGPSHSGRVKQIVSLCSWPIMQDDILVASITWQC